MTIRMALHAIRAGEGEQYIAAGVESVSRAGARRRSHRRGPQPRGSTAPRRIALRRVHPDGADRRERRPALLGHPEQQDEWAVISPYRAVRPATPPATSRRRSSRSRCRRTWRPARTGKDDRGRRDVGQPRRRPPPGNDDRGPGQAGAGVPPRRHGHRRQRVPAQRRCRRGADHVRGSGPRACGLQPKARILASTVAAIRPEIMGPGRSPRLRRCSASTGMTIDDVDIVEINEAFAAQIVPCRESWGFRRRS